MKLIIKRDQADVKGVFGGNKGVCFSLYAKADITGDELELIERYKVKDDVLVSHELPIRGVDSDIQYFNLTVIQLVTGRTVETGSIYALLELEEKIKIGCQNLKELMEVMKTFGGEEVIEI